MLMKKAGTSGFARLAVLLTLWGSLAAFDHAGKHHQDTIPIAGADEKSPSRAQYFSWINNTNEGPTDAQTFKNLAFFDWLHREYGMQLDIYAFDAGAIDSKRWYGSTRSAKFQKQFPNGLEPIYQRANSMGLRLGVWGGPDGFGDTAVEEQQRIDMMVELCDKYDFALFKFDSVAGNLRDSKQGAFSRMMTGCRRFAPDLILLNHRLNLGDTAIKHATTFLWEGLETYIDVHLANAVPAPHHRAGALSRGLPPKLQRLTEDHGVCLSSALDNWDDELVLQAFNRALILSPQIYCNPWLLSDAEFPKLARIFNLARDHRDLLTSGIILPEDKYGPSAVSRGDGETRIITLRNLSWQPKTYDVTLDAVLGLKVSPKAFQIRSYHPHEEVMGDFMYGETVEVTVPPFRSVLLKVSHGSEFGLTGVQYNVLRSVDGRPIEVELLGGPGSNHSIGFVGVSDDAVIMLDGQKYSAGAMKEGIDVSFNGQAFQQAFNRQLGVMQPVTMPGDAEALYEATVYAADNNALEVRSLERSGKTDHPEVKGARDAFFNQPLFVERAIWDRNLFDDDLATGFAVMNRWKYWWNSDPDTRVNDGGFRLDFGKIEKINRITLTSRDELSLAPAKLGEGIIAEVSADLKNWTEVRFVAAKEMIIDMPSDHFPVRYFRIKVDAPNWLSEVRAFAQGKPLDRADWRASNLFGAYERMDFQHAWKLEAKLDEIAPDSYLSVAVPGETGNEGVYAALKIDGKLVGAPDRAPSYVSNTWELQVKPVDGNYTYYIPLKESWVGKRLEVFLLGGKAAASAKPVVWLNRKDKPIVTKRLTYIQAGDK